MKLSGVTILALSAVLTLVVRSGTAVAAESSKPDCSKASDSMVLAEGPAYDGPGGGTIGYLSPGIKYVVVANLRHVDGESWILLAGPGGAHIGWIKTKAVTRNYLNTRCTVPIEGTYRRPQ